MKLRIILAVAAALLWGFIPAYAELTEQEPVQVELTTYYPAPYGEYDELNSETIYSNRVAIGGADVALPEAGRIAVENGVIFTPRSGDPTSVWGTGTAGELAYSSSKNEFYYNSGGTNWAAIGGGGIYCLTVYNNIPDTDVTCPGDLTKAADLGIWGFCYGGGTGFGFIAPFPPGGGCSVTLAGMKFDVGRAALCCKE